MRNKIPLLILLLIMLVIGGVVAFSITGRILAASSGQVTAREWPPFTMVYEDWSIGTNIEPPTVQVLRIIYTDKRHWRVELLDHSTAKELIGSWGEYNGREMSGFDPWTGEVTVIPDDLPEEGVYVPAQWLIPHYIPKLLTQQNVEGLEAAEGLAIILEKEYIPCQETTETMLQAGIKPCGTEDRLGERKITYRSEDYLPISIIDSVDGVEVHRITVQELVVGGSEVQIPSQ